MVASGYDSFVALGLNEKKDCQGVYSLMPGAIF